MNRIVKTSLVLFGFLGFIQPAFATEQKALELKTETIVTNQDIVTKDNYIKAKYASAENRFLQGNVKVSHDDYADLISKASHDDYVFLAYGIKMAEYGFFDLAEDLITKLDNNSVF